MDVSSDNLASVVSRMADHESRDMSTESLNAVALSQHFDAAAKAADDRLAAAEMASRRAEAKSMQARERVADIQTKLSRQQDANRALEAENKRLNDRLSQLIQAKSEQMKKMDGGRKG